MATAISVGQVEEAIAAAITALDASDYDQGTVTASWTEGERFTLSPDDPTSINHLAFHVFAEDSPVMDSTRDAHFDYVRLQTRVVVVFTYQLRPDAQVTDARRARDAARDVAAAVNALDGDRFNVTLLNLGTPAYSAEQSVLITSLLFDILHEVQI